MNTNKQACFRPTYPLHILVAVLPVALWICTSARGEHCADNVATSQDPISASRQYTFQDERLRNAIDRLAQSIRLNVVYHVSSLEIVDKPISILAIHDVSAPGAIDALLDAHKLALCQIDRSAIMIVDGKQSHAPIASTQSVMDQLGAEQAREELGGGQLSEDPPRLNVDYGNMTLGTALEWMARTAHLKILFDPAIEYYVRAASLTMTLKRVTIAQALKYTLDAYDLKYEEVKGDTINIVGGNHRHSSTPLEEIIKRLE